MIDLTGVSPRWPVRARRLWRRCLREAAKVTSAWETFCFQGDELLRAQLGRIHGLDPERLTITASVRAAALTYGRRETRIRLEQPCFDAIAYTLSGARLERSSWAALIHQPDERLVWLTSPARNPDGATLTAAECAALAGRRVVVNGAYLWFAPDAPRVPGADLLGSLHKIAGRGARLAWVHSEDFAEIAVPELIGTTPPPAWQRAWALFAARGGLAELASAVVAGTSAAVAAFRATATIELPTVDGPNMVLPLAAGVGVDEAVRRLAERGFLLLPATPFGIPFPALRATFTGVAPDSAGELGRLTGDHTLFGSARLKMRA
jgi:hypothetical protein